MLLPRHSLLHSMRRASSHLRQRSAAALDLADTPCAPAVPRRQTRTPRKGRGPVADGRVGAVAAEPAVLSTAQREAVRRVVAGESLLLTGGAGTGKTAVLKAMVRELPPTSTVLTASSGVAAVNSGGSTLHSFLGFRPGLEHHWRRSLRDRRFLRQRQGRLQQCGVLIIDEVSMVSPSLFVAADHLAQLCRGSTAPFGGMQVVLCGDFLQLPPVLAQRDGQGTEADSSPEAGLRYCFQTDSWAHLAPGTARLTQPFRQDADPALFSLLDAIRRGDGASVRPGLRDLHRPAPPSAVQLRCTNREVDDINGRRFAMLETTVHRFDAVDTVLAEAGSNAAVLGHALQRELRLRVGARVMLLKNLHVARGLVNGAAGTVVGFATAADVLRMASTRRSDVAASVAFAEPDQLVPLVDFGAGPPPCTDVEALPGSGRPIVAVGPVPFSLHSFDRIVAQTVQVPLRLAWALTVHKAQGLTLPEVDVDLVRAFEHNQGYVALSRAQTTAGLTARGITHRALSQCPLALGFDGDLP